MRNLCYEFKKLINRVVLPRGVIITTDRSYCSHPYSHSRPGLSKSIPISTLQCCLKRNSLSSHCLILHSLRYYHNSRSTYSIVRARSTIIGAVTLRPLARQSSTNCTSVSPPPTPSTQGECLPSSVSDSHSEDNIQILEPPTNCCMSGCANCVWITYAQELAELYKDSGKAAESVMNALDDPSLKMFLNLELKEKLNSEQ